MDFIINDFEKIKTEDEFELIRQTFFNEIENKVVGNYQFVYINCEYGLLNTCMQIARRLKNRCKVILGGRFINYLHAANRLMKTPNIDLFTYISLGDPEKDLVNIINNVDQYIISKECNTIFYNSGLISDLDKIQMPKWFAFDLDKYDGKLYLVASKGCKYNKCTFCDERLIWGDTFRIRKLDEIVREIQFNMKHYNISEFFFWDASIASYPYIRSLCHAIIDKNINCSWTALVRADEITDELARLMKNAGCHTIEVGIETLSEESHKLLNKGETIDTIKRSIEILKSNNIKVEGSFLIGYIGDCETNILYTIEEAKNLHLDAYRWHNFEFPSTYLK
jgi:radical SAM superfamily enzyme YgiQ (UPF0313 family)